MTILDVLGSIGIGIGIELLVVLFLLIKYLVCITCCCGWGEEEPSSYCDDCVCEHGGDECCKQPYIPSISINKIEVEAEKFLANKAKEKAKKGKTKKG